MFDSQILDTAIGLTFIYFFLSILCSAIIEIVASLTKKRSRMLGIGILALIQDPKALEKFYQQPFFMGKTPPGNIFKSFFDSIVPFPSWKSRVPSYITSRSFVLSLFESLKQHPDVLKTLLNERIAQPNHQHEIRGFTEKVAQLPDGSIIKKELEGVLASAGTGSDEVFKKVQEWYAKTVENLVNDGNEEASGFPGESILNEIKILATGDYLKDVRALVDALPDSNSLKKTLLPLLNIAGDSLETALQNVEKWYEEGMERVTGWYKKYSQTFGVIMGLVVALVLNADSFEMGKAMYRDKELRTSLVTIASQQVASMEQLSANAGSGGKEPEKKSDRAEVTISSVVDAGKPVSQTGALSSESTQTTANEKLAESKKNDLNKKIKQINEDFKQISSINLPIGWPIQNGGMITLSQIIELLTPEKILGILITALMVSMGSNFWYELLSKLLNVRSAGKKPLTSEELDGRKK